MKLPRGDLGAKKYQKVTSSPARHRYEFERRTRQFAEFVRALADKQVASAHRTSAALP
jgi:hypothetical protein